MIFLPDCERKNCFAAVRNIIFNKREAKIPLFSKLEMRRRCGFNRNSYITFFWDQHFAVVLECTISHSGKSYSIFMLVCKTAIPVIYIVATKEMLAMWPRYKRMAQFRQVLRAQQSPCFSSGTNLWALKYFRHFWKFDGSMDGSDSKKEPEERIVAGEDVSYVTVGLEKIKVGHCWSN